VRDYKAVMGVMKKRGARRSAPEGAEGLGAAESFAPLNILAEGDSWFDYPVPFFGGGVIPRLEKRIGAPILNLAKAGDEVRYMLGVAERKELIDRLRRGSPAGGAWDALLFSGGGNDVVDNPMALWVKDWNPATPPEKHLHQQRFDNALALVKAGYEDIIAIRDTLAPDTHLFFHAYDFAIPDGRGVCFLGPWLKPTFDLRKFPTRAAASAVVISMLKQFAAMLKTLAKRQKVHVIKTQGTLVPQTSSWDNELHPSKAGFEAFADLFHGELKRVFPDRVA
jgi:hypothetical protein